MLQIGKKLIAFEKKLRDNIKIAQAHMTKLEKLLSKEDMEFLEYHGFQRVKMDYYVG